MEKWLPIQLRQQRNNHMIITITINCGGPEFCCGKATAQIGLMLGKLVGNLEATGWNGQTELDWPLRVSNGTIVGRITVRKRAPLIDAEIVTKSNPV